MFCAKCGSQLSVAEVGNFECPSGLDYSAFLSKQLRSEFPVGLERAAAPEGDSLHVSRGLYCPGCGVALRAGACPACGKKLSGKTIYHLVEFHPHPDGRGGYF